VTTCRTTLGAAAIAVLVLSGCGAEPSSPPRPTSVASTPPSTTTSTPASTSTSTGTPRLDLDDNGSTVDLPVGGNATITLVDRTLRWSDPTVDGTAVTITEQVSDAPSAGRTWRVVAQEPGEARITVPGSPTCRSATPPCTAPDRLWSVRFRVR